MGSEGGRRFRCSLVGRCWEISRLVSGWYEWVGGKLDLPVDFFLDEEWELVYATSEVDDFFYAVHVDTPSVVVPLEVL